MLYRDVGTLDFQGASRTDAGVHALGQRATFSFEERRTLRELVRGLNGLTPDTIRVESAREVPEGMNARHDSRGKHYRFRIYNSRYPHPLELNRTWHVKNKLDAARMHEAAQHLLGTHDFTSFRASDCQAQTTVREMTHLDVQRHGEDVIVNVRGTAFLKYMVRNFVGTLVEVGRGRMTPDEIPGVLAARDRQVAGPTAEPQGLTLIEVFYAV
jgi:tRNA pseudouridine38-40 synthase